MDNEISELKEELKEYKELLKKPYEEWPLQYRQAFDSARELQEKGISVLEARLDRRREFIQSQSSNASLVQSLIETLQQHAEEQRQQLAQLPQRLREIMEESQASTRFSQAPSACVESLMAAMNIKMAFDDETDGFCDTLFVDDIDSFQWDETAAENHQLNKSRYLMYLDTHLQMPDRMHLIDASSDQSLLNVIMGGKEFTGTTDVIITSHKGFPADCAHVLFELKKPGFSTKKMKNQAILKLLAYQKSSFAVICVLTDLNDLWDIFWLERPSTDFNGSCRALLHSRSLSRGLALGFLRYHLRVWREVLRREVRYPSPADDPDDPNFRPSDPDESSDDAKARKRVRLISKSRPTFNAACLEDTQAPMEADDYQKELLSDMTREEVITKLWWKMHDRFKLENALPETA